MPHQTTSEEKMRNEIENLPIHEDEFEKLVNAYCDAIEGGETPVKVNVLEATPIAGEDGVLVKFSFDATEAENGTSDTTYAAIYGSLYTNRDNDLLYFLHDWQNGEIVEPTVEDISEHDWELANEWIRPSDILNG